MPSSRKPLLTLVESLGDNCELGFYQEANGYFKGSLLRFARLSTDSAIRLIRSETRRAFAFDDLRPYSRTMIQDTASGIAFHTKMHSTRTPEGWRFDAPAEERRAQYEDEKSKFDYLLDGFEENLNTDTPRIYAIKANDGIPDERIAELDAALRARKSPEHFVLLAIQAADASGEDPASDVLRWDSDTVCRARIRELAPYDATADFDETAWDVVFDALAGEAKVAAWVEGIARAGAAPAAGAGDAAAA